MAQDDQERPKMPQSGQNDQEQPKVAQNGPEWVRMGQNDSERPRIAIIAQSGPEWPITAPKSWGRARLLPQNQPREPRMNPIFSHTLESLHVTSTRNLINPMPAHVRLLLPRRAPTSLTLTSAEDMQTSFSLLAQNLCERHVLQIPKIATQPGR